MTVIRQVTRGQLIGLLAVAAAIFGFPLFMNGDPYYLGVEILVLIWAMAGLAWNIIGGYQNQFALGHSVFFAIGAYGSSLMNLRFGWSPWIGMWPGIILAGIVSTLIAWLCLRLKGAFYALATFALSQVVFIVAQIWSSLTNGTQGLAIPFEPSLRNFIFESPVSYVYCFGLIVLLFIVLTYWLENSRFGLASRSLSQDEGAAAALGVHTLRAKVTGAAISGALTAIAGVCYAQYLLFIDPRGVAGIEFSIQVSLIVVFGGAATVMGPLLGAAVLIPISSWLQSTLGTGAHAEQAPSLTTLVYGLVLTVTLLYLPQGLGPRIGQFFRDVAAVIVKRVGGAGRTDVNGADQVDARAESEVRNG